MNVTVPAKERYQPRSAQNRAIAASPEKQWKTVRSGAPSSASTRRTSSCASPVVDLQHLPGALGQVDVRPERALLGGPRGGVAVRHPVVVQTRLPDDADARVGGEPLDLGERLRQSTLAARRHDAGGLGRVQRHAADERLRIGPVELRDRPARRLRGRSRSAPSASRRRPPRPRPPRPPGARARRGGRGRGGCGCRRRGAAAARAPAGGWSVQPPAGPPASEASRASSSSTTESSSLRKTGDGGGNGVPGTIGDGPQAGRVAPRR